MENFPDSSPHRDPLRVSSEAPDLGGLFSDHAAADQEQASEASAARMSSLTNLLERSDLLGVERGELSPQEFAAKVAGSAVEYLMRSFNVERAEEVATVLEQMYEGYRVAEQRASADLNALRKLGAQQASAKVTLASSREAFPVLKNKAIHLSGPLGDPGGKTTRTQNQVSVSLCSNIVEYAEQVGLQRNAVLVFPDLPALMLSGLVEVATLPGSTTYLLNQSSRAVAVHEAEANKTLRSNLGLTNAKGTTVLKEGRSASAAAALRAQGAAGTIDRSGLQMNVKVAIEKAEWTLGNVRIQASILDPLQDLQAIIALYCSESNEMQAARNEMVNIAQAHSVNLMEYRFHSTSRGSIRAISRLGQMVIEDGRPDAKVEVRKLMSCMQTLATVDDTDLVHKCQQSMIAHLEPSAEATGAEGPTPPPRPA